MYVYIAVLLLLLSLLLLTIVDVFSSKIYSLVSGRENESTRRCVRVCVCEFFIFIVCFAIFICWLPGCRFVLLKLFFYSVCVCVFLVFFVFYFLIFIIIVFYFYFNFYFFFFHKFLTPLDLLDDFEIFSNRSDFERLSVLEFQIVFVAA